MDSLSSTQVLIFTGALGAIVSLLTARATISSEAVKSLNMALAGLRTEFDAVQRERVVERRERDAYKAYIDVLVKLLNTHAIAVPPFPDWRSSGEVDNA